MIRPLRAGLLTLACALLPHLAAAQQGDQPAPPTARDKRVAELEESAPEIADHPVESMDCFPEAPFLVCMEKSKFYNARLMLDAFREALTRLYPLFKERFGKLYDAKTFDSRQVCLVYVFETKYRYAEFTKAPDGSSGVFDPSRGTLFTYKDSMELYETLFHEGARQLLASIAGMKDATGDGTGDTTMAWLSMGVATWFENFKRDATGGFKLGEKSSFYLPFVKRLFTARKSRKLDEFFKITSKEFEKIAQDRRQLQEFASQAWAFWYFMQTAKDGAYREKLDEYFKKEMEQKGGYEAAKECFGDLESLNREFEGFISATK